MIRLEGLSKRYGDTRAVDALDLTVSPGRVTGFLGPNGAGKSTTMRMILGLDTPTAGTALVDGRPYAACAGTADRSRRPARRQGPAPAARPATEPAVRLARQQRPSGAAGSTQVLAVVGLGPVAGKRAGQFSLGMGQRLGIAGALLGDPTVLIFDEPVNGLDPDGVRWVRDLSAPRGRGPHGVRLQPPDVRDGADRRPADRHRPRPADRGEHLTDVRRSSRTGQCVTVGAPRRPARSADGRRSGVESAGDRLM